jgi:hypothetical protein
MILSVGVGLRPAHSGDNQVNGAGVPVSRNHQFLRTAHANASVNDGTRLTIRETSPCNGTAAPASSANRTL